MALPFIVGPHQCSHTHGPDGRPQVEIVLRIRQPLAEFFDALLLSLADQRPLFQQSGYRRGQSGTTDRWSHWPLAERGGPLAVLSQATSISDTAAVGAATTTKDLPTPNINEGRMPPITEPGEGQPDSQAACSRDPNQQHPPHGRGQRHISVLLRTLRNARSSESPRNLLS